MFSERLIKKAQTFSYCTNQAYINTTIHVSISYSLKCDQKTCVIEIRSLLGEPTVLYIGITTTADNYIIKLQMPTNYPGMTKYTFDIFPQKLLATF